MLRKAECADWGLVLRSFFQRRAPPFKTMHSEEQALKKRIIVQWGVPRKEFSLTNTSGRHLSRARSTCGRISLLRVYKLIADCKALLAMICMYLAIEIKT